MYFVIKEEIERSRAYGPGDVEFTKRVIHTVLATADHEEKAMAVVNSHMKTGIKVYVTKALAVTTFEPKTEKL